jgi:hypothetical protein
MLLCDAGMPYTGCAVQNKGATAMIRTAYLGLNASKNSSKNIFGRLMSFVERFLDANAKIAARNDDPPYFGL